MYEDYPDFAINPKVNEIVKRCQSLDIPVFKKNGQPYAYSTLRTRCLKRKLEGRPAKGRGTRVMHGGGGLLLDTASKLALPAALLLAKKFLDSKEK